MTMLLTRLRGNWSGARKLTGSFRLMLFGGEYVAAAHRRTDARVVRPGLVTAAGGRPLRSGAMRDR